MTKNVMEDALGIARGYAGGENCVISHPDASGPCGRPATGMVWELGFCEVHGIEAAAAALEELTEDAEMGFEALVGAEKGRPESNPVLLHVLKEAEVPARDARAGHSHDQDEALRIAYPPLEGRIDPEVLAFDYETHYSDDGPVDWWADARHLLCRFMRQANSRGLPELVRELEPLRERACAQLVQAEDDYERRYVAPRRAARD